MIFPFEFILFGATLLGIMLFSNLHIKLASIGLISIILYKLFLTDIDLS